MSCDVCAGDPKQLGPIITCRLAAEYGLATSLLERGMAEAPYLRQAPGEVSLVTFRHPWMWTARMGHF